MKVSKHSRCAIVGGGDINSYSAVEPLLLGSFVISADSGLRHCRAMGVRPDLLVGDFDSHKGPIPTDIPRVIFDPLKKDYTDSTFALEEALERGAGEILFAGMLGGRLDHTLANLQNLARCAQLGVACRLTDGVTDVWAAKGPAHFTVPFAAEHYFSLLAHSDDCHGVTIRGAQYALDRHTLSSVLPRAVSNEFAKGDAQIQWEDGVLLITRCPKALSPRA